jgi:hypothetical protein
MFTNPAESEVAEGREIDEMTISPREVTTASNVPEII